MVSKAAVMAAVKEQCKGMEYASYECGTGSLYVQVNYGGEDVCMRFSDHQGNHGLPWCDISGKKTRYTHVVQYIQDRLETVNRKYRRACFRAIS